MFLNTARTMAATSNPQANIQQVANNNNIQQQPVSSNVNSTNGVQPQSNGINPITIPIQIQPQIAQMGQPVQNGNNQGIQTIGNQTNVQQSQAPTPQQYQGNNASNNVVDFSIKIWYIKIVTNFIFK